MVECDCPPNIDGHHTVTCWSRLRKRMEAAEARAAGKPTDHVRELHRQIAWLEAKVALGQETEQAARAMRAQVAAIRWALEALGRLSEERVSKFAGQAVDKLSEVKS